MTNYRIYSFGPDNHIARAFDVECETDESAKAAAMAMLRNGFAIEVWQETRFVCQLPINREAPLGQRLAREN